MKTYHTLDDVQMSAIDRAHAMAHMQSAEATINFVVGAMAKARAVTAAVGRCNQPGAADASFQPASAAVATRYQPSAGRAAGVVAAAAASQR